MARPGGNPDLPKFKKNDPRINRRGRPPGQLPSKAIVWDLRMAARAYCKEALDFIVETMRDPNENRDTRLKAAGMLLERGYGRPLQEAVVDMNHRFVVAPDTMDIDTWLKRKGQPVGDNEWLDAQRAKETPALEERISDAPASAAGHSTEPETIDLTVESEPRREPVDPSKPN
jgi:hypothetical protein